MYILTELGYALMCQVKEKEKTVVLKMLLYKRVKAQQEIKVTQRIAIIFNLNVHFHGFVSLHYEEH